MEAQPDNSGLDVGEVGTGGQFLQRGLDRVGGAAHLGAPGAVGRGSDGRLRLHHGERQALLLARDPLRLIAVTRQQSLGDLGRIVGI
jgi:hypothetical protein